MTAIPKTIHQVWVGPRPAPNGWMKTWKDMNPGWGYRVWDEPKILALLNLRRQTASLRWFRKAIHERRYDAAADIARVNILLEHGGVYVDADSECLRSLDGLVPDDVGCWAVQEETDPEIDMVVKRVIRGWDGRIVTNSFLGSVPGHPVMLRYRASFGKLRTLEPPWVQTGPVLMTRVVDESVRVLPMWMFFPSKLRGGKLVREGEPYATHHWSTTAEHNTGTGKPYPDAGSRHVVILVPWRGGDEIRERNWAIARRYLEGFDYPIFTGDRKGPWSRAAAVNAAAKAAGEWDVAMIADADTIQEVGAAHRAIASVGISCGAAIPWNVRWLLDEKATVRLKARNEAPLRDTRRWGKQDRGAGSTLIVAREAWDAVGGFDEHFVGWGLEDRAIVIAMKTLSSVRHFPGVVWHLNHPVDPISIKYRHTLGGSPEMSQYFQRYRAAIKDTEKMLALCHPDRAQTA